VYPLAPDSRHRDRAPRRISILRSARPVCHHWRGTKPAHDRVKRRVRSAGRRRPPERVTPAPPRRL